MKETNPKCQIISSVKGDYSQPLVDITFGMIMYCITSLIPLTADSSRMCFNPEPYDVLTIIGTINTKTRTI